MHKSEYEWCAVEITGKDENTECERRKEKKQQIEFTTQASSSVLHLHTTGNLLGSTGHSNRCLTTCEGIETFKLNQEFTWNCLTSPQIMTTSSIESGPDYEGA